MSALKFAFPEKQFFLDKENPNTIEFLEGVDIDLSKESTSDFPTLLDVHEAILKTSFRFDLEQFVEDEGKSKWSAIIGKKGENYSPIYIENVSNNSDFVKSIYFNTGDDTAIIEFLIQLSVFCGSIIFYKDSGEMTLIRPGKTMHEIVDMI